MRFNDGATDPKSHAEAMSFSGKEGVKDLVRLFRGQSQTRINDRNHQLLIFCMLRPYEEFAYLIDTLHRVDAVHDEVHDDLLHLHRIHHDLGKLDTKVG